MDGFFIWQLAPPAEKTLTSYRLPSSHKLNFPKNPPCALVHAPRKVIGLPNNESCVFNSDGASGWRCRHPEVTHADAGRERQKIPSR